MDPRLRRSLLATCLVFAGVGAALEPANSGPTSLARDRTEVVAGTFHCGVGQDGGYLWFGLSSTGDIFAEQTFFQNIVPATNNPAEYCASAAELARETLVASACSVGEVRILSDETGVAHDFSFSCHERRSKLIALIAELGRLALVP